MKIQLKRSDNLKNQAALPPSSGAMEDGELAVNYNAADPTIFIKDSNGDIIKIATTASTDQGILWENTDSKLYPADLTHYIGIGTKNPGAPLAVENSSVPEIRLIRTNSTGNYAAFTAQGGNSENLIISADNANKSNASIELKVSNKLALFMNSAGNVGIQKNNPTAALDVTGGGKFSQKVTSATTVEADSDQTLTTKKFVQDLIDALIDDNALWTEKNGALVPIKISNNLGVGQENPSQKLDVNGNINVTGDIYIGGRGTSALTRNTDGSSTITTKSYVDARDAALKSELQGQINSGVSGGTFWKLTGDDLSPKSTSYDVAIGKDKADEALDVQGNTNVSGWLATRKTTSSDNDWIVTTKSYVDNEVTIIGEDVVAFLLEYIEDVTLWSESEDGNDIFPENTKYSVGIGNKDPKVKLDVTGDIRATGIIYADENKPVATEKYVDDKVGAADTWDQTGNTLHPQVIANNVGINIKTATEKLHVAGNIKATGSIYASNNQKVATESYVVGKVNGIDFWNRSSGKLYPQTIADKVGINTTNPLYPLHVNGDIKCEDKIYSAATSSGDGSTTVTTKGYVDSLVSSNNYWTLSSGKLYPKSTNNKVGIGLTNPATPLHVKGEIRTDGKVRSSETVSGDSNNICATKGYVDSKVSGAGYWSRGTNKTYLTNNGDNLGVGTTSPSQKLHVVGNILCTGTVTASGGKLATESFVNTQVGNSGEWTSNGTKVYPKDYTRDLVGIGTNNPDQKLTVVGNIKCSGKVYANNSKELSTVEYVNSKVNGIDYWDKSGSNLYTEGDVSKVGIKINNPEVELHVNGDIIATNFRIDKLTEI